jgi:hypothetical protein
MDDAFQTCTRAMRADFCGDGHSYTVNGTIIDLYDRFPYRHETSADEDQTALSLKLEALWVRDPSFSSDVGAVQHTVACMAKKRWDTMPFEPCGDLFPDPRHFDDVHQPAPYCDDIPVSTWLHNPNIVEVTKSAYIDAGLWRWRYVKPTTKIKSNRINGELRVTSRLTTTADPTGADAGFYRAPADAVVAEPMFLGAVYSPDGSDHVRPSYAIPLYSYRRTSDGEYTTTTLGKPGPEYADGVLEGYINAPGCISATPRCDSSKPLYLYRRSNGDTFLTVPGVPLPADPTLPTFVTRLGFLPR